MGDSVAASAREEVAQRGGADHSVPQLSLVDGRPALRRLARQGAQVVVVALGAIDLAYRTPADRLRTLVLRVLRDDLGGVGCVVWVEVNANPHPALRHWPSRARRFNDLLAEEAGRRGAVVARWSHLAAQRLEEQRDWFESDHFHLRPRGQSGYAGFVSETVARRCPASG